MAEKNLKNKLVCHDSDYDDDDDENSASYESYESDCGLSLEKLNLGPRKKLLVFSLSGLLVYRVFRGKKFEIPRNRDSDGRYGKHLVFKRPFVEEFMKFCLERFEVGIWSSAQGVIWSSAQGVIFGIWSSALKDLKLEFWKVIPNVLGLLDGTPTTWCTRKNVDGVLGCLMGRLKEKLLFVWDQYECTDSGFKSLENKRKPLFFKELGKVWKHFDGKYSESDTLFIDDQPYKALLNPPYTGIFLESYNADNDDDKALDPRGELGKYLDGLADAKDVQIYVKENPFGQPAISPDHSDWDFYSKVLRRLGKQLKC